jgi:3-dehydroquinate dehydratase I
MSTLRALLDSGVPLVVASFYDDEVLAEKAPSLGVDVAELRIDQFSRTDVEHVVRQARLFGGMPTLATVRAAHEGGAWQGTDEERLELYRAVLPFVDAVDVELSSRAIRDDVIAAAREHDAVVIGSFHDFTRTPDLGDLEAVVAEGKAVGVDLVKVSTMATSREDLRRLASLLVNDSGLIVIAMGAVGTVSRVFFPALGSRLTFSFIGDKPTSGQLAFDEMSALMRKFYPEDRPTPA